MSARVLRISPDLALPLNAATQKLAALGRTGSGKSYAMTKLAEEMHDAGIQIVTLDPVGIWWGLRLAADGKAPGISIPVFGGLHGDVPLEPTAGAMVADLVVDRGISVVIDVSQFEHDTDKAKFAGDFGARFYFRKKASPSAVHVFLEECQEFVPQNPQKGEERMLHAWQRTVRLGRNFGIGVTLISQRPQDVHKKALNQTECLLAFQLTGPHERKAVEGWIAEKGIEADISALLPKLQVGEAHVWSPAWLKISKTVAIAAKRTFDASSTPKVGTRTEIRELAPIDLEQLRASMAKTIEKAKAEDPRELQKRIKQLEAELKKAATSAPAKTVEKKVVDQDAIAKAVDRAVRAQQLAMDRGLAVLARALAPALVHLDKALSLGKDADALLTSLRQAGVEAHQKLTPPDSAAATRSLPAAPRPPVERVVPRAVTRDKSADTNGGISGVQQKILDTIRAFELLGIDQPDRVNVAAWCGYHQNAKSFSNALGASRSAGLVWYPDGGKLALTDEGRALANDDAPITSLEELHAKWFERLSGVERKILEAVMAHRDGIDRDELAAEVEYHPNAKSFSNSLGRLRSLGLLTKSGPVKPTSTLFPAALV